MIYIYNKYISPKKNISRALTTIYGIGLKQSIKIAQMLCLNPNYRFEQLTSIEISKIIKYIGTEYKVGNLLQKEINENIKKYIKIRHYKGLRHKNKLPVRGQRTHTNARTRKNNTITL